MPKALTVSNSTEFHPVGKCKLCKLMTLDRNTWVQLHEMVIQDGMSYGRVAVWANTRLEVINASLPEDKRLAPFVRQNFDVHFKEHVPDIYKVKRAVSKAVKPEIASELTPSIPVEEAVQANASLERMTPVDLDSYQSLQNALTVVQDLFNIRSREIAGASNPQITKVNQVQKLAETLFDLHQALLKYRNDAKITRMAVQTSLELCGMAYANGLNELTAEIFDLSDADKVRQLKERLALKMGNSTKEVLLKVISDFRLR